ncbi:MULTISPECIES: hypothetical protein [unclassified Niallia]|uniref:hypothetical protein n=1 Tax=unclassified Niallia TaxID=2837522 RepID=UPI0030F4CC42
MIRFANPGSDIEHIVEIFKKIYAQLSDFSSFNLDNMADVMTSAKMASSKGYVGEEALKRSYAIKDTSRNPLYNQAKMYAEVYRMFGWMNSGESALEFNFTLLGAHVALSGKSTKSIVELCLLGIYFPNQLISTRFTNKGKPYISIMKYFNALDDILNRDEMIIGALNLENSEDEEELKESVSLIRKLRIDKNSKAAMLLKMEELSKDLDISCTTMRNYTRILIAALKYTGWAEEIKYNTYGRNTKFLRITDYGKSVQARASKFKYVTLSDLEDLNELQINAICKIGFLSFLKMADFAVEEDLESLTEEVGIIKEIFGTSKIFFNPFQTFSKENILMYFPEGNLESDVVLRKEFTVTELQEIEEVMKREVGIRSHDASGYKHNKTAKLIIEMLNEHNENEKLVIEKLLDQILIMKQTNFYPLVAELFGIIFRLDARTPQAGVNNERFDVIIPDENNSIPVEVKSPTEEMLLSVKAVRQALENKIILLSRRNYNTSKEISSIAVGFSIPNKRSDVYLLIEDIKKTYNINIAITSIDQLLSAAINCLKNEKKYNVADFKDVYGVIKFEDL